MTEELCMFKIYVISILRYAKRSRILALINKRRYICIFNLKTDEG